MASGHATDKTWQHLVLVLQSTFASFSSALIPQYATHPGIYNLNSRILREWFKNIFDEEVLGVNKCPYLTFKKTYFTTLQKYPNSFKTSVIHNTYQVDMSFSPFSSVSLIVFKINNLTEEHVYMFCGKSLRTFLGTVGWFVRTHRTHKSYYTHDYYLLQITDKD